VVHALENVHRALRPGGLLLDVRPEPGDAVVEVVSAGRAARIGVVEESERGDRIRRARAALTRIVRRGWLVRERAVRFRFVSHADTVDDWLAHREEKGATSVLDPALVEQARALLAGGAGPLRLRERATATRYRRLP
jgi:hypothetical protein